MAILEKLVKVSGGMGGVNNDSIPVYASDKAPAGSWAVDIYGKQIMWVNGKKLVMVDPEQGLINPSLYFAIRDGKIAYCRVWEYDEASGQGVDKYAFQTWVEYSHLAEVEIVPEPEPEPDPSAASEVYEVMCEITEPGHRYLTLKKVS